MEGGWVAAGVEDPEVGVVRVTGDLLFDPVLSGAGDSLEEEDIVIEAVGDFFG